MKLVLLTLSGDAAKARDKLANAYPDANIETVSRSQIGTGAFVTRLSALRALRPDVFAIATERLSWQRGPHLLMLFGALAGAGEVLMIDAHGGLLKRSRLSLLLSAPAKLTLEAISSAKTSSNAHRKLLQLERQVEQSKLEPPAAPVSAPRVAYIRSTPGPGTQIGGAASHIKGVVESLVELGCEVDVFSNDAIAGLNGDKISLTVVEPRSFGGTRALFDMQSNLVFTRIAVPLIERVRPDFIYQRYARFGWTGVVASLRINRPLFLEYNGSEVWVGRHWDQVGSLDLLARYERLNLSAATKVFVVSDVERRNLENTGVAAEKIVVNPNGVNPDTFRPGVGGDKERSELGIDSEEVVVGFVGTFGPWHGVVTLAEAIKLIPARDRVRFLFVGSGSLQADVERILKLECANRRVIFTGAVSHDRVPALLDACQILVAPHVPLADGSEFFGSPTKLFEYMAMGKAIVASRLGQIGDVLENEKTAILVEPANVSELAAAILRLVGATEMRTRLGEQARAVALQKYTWKHNAQRVLDAYHHWLERN